jgi:hypothetical protein
MKRMAIAVLLGLALGSGCLAQQDPADPPASKADIERYLEAVNGRELVRLRLKAGDDQIHQIMHNALKDQPNLPADFEQYLMRIVDDMMKDLTEETLIEATIPVYQKHLTKGDGDALIAFYSTPRGKKILKELPAIQVEAAQATAAILQPAMTRAVDRMQEEITRAQKESAVPSKSQTQQN